MTVALDENLRKAMDSAVRALEERVSLTTKLQHDAERRQHRLSPTTARSGRMRRGANSTPFATPSGGSMLRGRTN
jgi:hypothetical protein